METVDEWFLSMRKRRLNGYFEKRSKLGKQKRSSLDSPLSKPDSSLYPPDRKFARCASRKSSSRSILRRASSFS
jgi:hypothetical protein